MNCPRWILATSIPPQLRGVSWDSLDTSSFQQRTLTSWREAGFTPVSLHTASELQAHPDHLQQLSAAGVSVLEVQQADPEPLPNLLAGLTALLQHYPDHLIAITNADILFAPSGALSHTIRSLRPNQALLGRRTNIPSDPDLSPAVSSQEDIHGFDFFACSAASLQRTLPLIPSSLVFGRPWWDLFLPMALLAANLELVDPGAHNFLHPSHVERWSAEQWYSHGRQADQRFRVLLRQQGHHAFARRWKRQRYRAVLRWPGITGLRHQFREQRRSLLRQRRWLPLYLSGVSEAINALIDAERIAVPRQ